MPPSNKPPSTGPSGELNVLALVLTEMRAMRQENREQTDSILKHLGSIDQRLQDGTKRMDDQSGRIENLEQIAAKPGMVITAPAVEPKTASAKKSKVSWWVVAAATGALTLVGDRFAKFIINGLADPPVASAPLPSKP